MVTNETTNDELEPSLVNATVEQWYEESKAFVGEHFDGYGNVEILSRLMQVHGQAALYNVAKLTIPVESPVKIDYSLINVGMLEYYVKRIKEISLRPGVQGMQFKNCTLRDLIAIVDAFNQKDAEAAIQDGDSK